MTTPSSAGSPSEPPPWKDSGIGDIITALQRKLSERSAVPLRLVGLGLSTVAIGDDEEVFRVPLNREAAAAQDRLRSLLPLLAPHLPVPIPMPLRELSADDSLPFGALVLRRLPGQPLAGSCTSPAIAGILADFLTTLHVLPVTLAPASLLRHDRDEADREIQATALPAFHAVVSDLERDAARRWWDAYFADPSRHAVRPVIVHGDFWHENILVDAAGDHVTGIIDWENCSLGDPVTDLAPLWHAGPALFEAVLTRYTQRTGAQPEALRRRARWQFGRRAWAGLAWTVRLHDAAEFPDAVAKVRAVLAATEGA